MKITYGLMIELEKKIYIDYVTFWFVFFILFSLSSDSDMNLSNYFYFFSSVAYHLLVNKKISGCVPTQSPGGRYLKIHEISLFN